MSQAENFNQSSNASHNTSEAQEILDIFWEKEMDDIRSLGPVSFIFYNFFFCVIFITFLL